MSYSPKDYTHLLGMEGFSDGLLTDHFTLYKGYVTNTNNNLDLLKSLETGSYAWAEVKRRLGWEFNGMRLHELYFGNLGGDGIIRPSSGVEKAIIDEFGSFSAWENDFRKSASMRGIGWVILYKDPENNRLFNSWINEHDVAHPAGCYPLLVMDVFEHAFIRDYALARGSYIDSFFKNINWTEVNDRL